MARNGTRTIVAQSLMEEAGVPLAVAGELLAGTRGWADGGVAGTGTDVCGGAAELLSVLTSEAVRASESCELDGVCARAAAVADLSIRISEAVAASETEELPAGLVFERPRCGEAAGSC